MQYIFAVLQFNSLGKIPTIDEDIQNFTMKFCSSKFRSQFRESNGLYSLFLNKLTNLM